MTERISKDRAVELWINVVKANTVAMTEVKGALETLNDNNVLHTGALKEMIGGNKELVKTFKWFWRIIMLAFAALIVLAGAEKVFQIPGLIPKI
jgi:hypothetical protein